MTVWLRAHSASLRTSMRHRRLLRRLTEDTRRSPAGSLHGGSPAAPLEAAQMQRTFRLRQAMGSASSFIEWSCTRHATQDCKDTTPHTCRAAVLIASQQRNS